MIANEFHFHIHSQSRKRNHLKWFEELFIRISGDDDQPIQIHDFKIAVHSELVSGLTVCSMLSIIV